MTQWIDKVASTNLALLALTFVASVFALVCGAISIDYSRQDQGGSTKNMTATVTGSVTVFFSLLILSFSLAGMVKHNKVQAAYSKTVAKMRKSGTVTEVKSVAEHQAIREAQKQTQQNTQPTTTHSSDDVLL